MSLDVPGAPRLDPRRRSPGPLAGRLDSTGEGCSVAPAHRVMLDPPRDRPVVEVPFPGRVPSNPADPLRDDGGRPPG